MSLALVLGLCLNYVGLSAVKMLFWSAVLNGVLAPPLILLVVVLTSDRRTMGDQTNPPLLRWMGWLSALVMAGAALAMFVAQ
jgi:Mn2+/Fe2+ NRAMP family transporter